MGWVFGVAQADEVSLRPRGCSKTAHPGGACRGEAAGSPAIGCEQAKWRFGEVLTRSGASIFIGLGVAVEEDLQLLLELGEIDLYRLEGIGDLAEADLLIGLVGAVESLLVAVLLDHLATVSDLIEAKSGRGPLQKVAEAGQFVQVLLSTGRKGGCQFTFEDYFPGRRPW